MKAYETQKIRNIAVLGHGGAGKTTVLEAAAFVTGVISRMGKVTDGSTISDFDKEETKRGFSLSMSLIPVEWEDIKINFLDTPGYFDFIGEAEAACSAADAAVIVINGKAGMQVGVQKAWDLCEKYNLPRLFFVTNMDDANANYVKVCEQLKDAFGTSIAPFQVPIREGEKFVGFVNVPKMSARKFTGTKGEYVECDIPASVKDQLDETRNALMEAVAETDEDLLERFLMEEEFTPEEIETALSKGVSEGSVMPVLMGSGLNGYGVRVMLHDIEKYFPSPAKRSISGTNTLTDKEFAADYDEAKAPTAKIFKTLIDPFLGKYSFFKVCSGTVKGDMTFYNAQKDTEEKVSKIYVLRGKEQIEVPELHAGDIGVFAKMMSAGTGDSLSSKAEPVVFPAPEFSKPYTSMAYRAVNKGDDDKIATSLTKLLEEDPTLKLVNDKENRQLLIYGIGDQQLEIAMSKLLSRYKVQAELYQPKVAFRETIRGSVHVQGKHKKQSGGHGQYGDVVMDFEPSGDLDTPYIFEEKIVGGVVPKNFFPAVEKGLQEMVVKGPLAGYPIVGMKASLVYGSYHPVDSSEMAFKLATHLAVKACFADKNSKPCLLEPIASVKVTVPNDFTGDVMGDMSKRRGRVMGTTPEGRYTVVEAECPMSELFGYNTDLRSMTGGIGSFAYEFARYEQAPSDVQEKEIAARASEKEDED